jgi:hypothetical protein
VRPIPHSAVTHVHMVEYLDDLVTELAASTEVLKRSKEFKAIYKNSLAGFLSLKALSRKQLPLPRSAAELTRRIPVLVASRQAVQATAELRRFIELIAWWPYFKDHPVEWSHFATNPWLGYVKYDANPIAFAAHRELSYYLAYILEKADCSVSSILGAAVSDLQAGYAETSRFVHAGGLADPDTQLAAFDDLTASVLRQFGALQKSVVRAGVIVSAWINDAGVHALPAVERSWFDWLLGRDATNAIRSGVVAE